MLGRWIKRKNLHILTLIFSLPNIPLVRNGVCYDIKVVKGLSARIIDIAKIVGIIEV